MDAILLEPADYWKLMKLGADQDAAQAQLKLAVAGAAAAKAAREAFARELAKKYPAFVVEDAHYRADDLTCTLIRER